MFNDMDLARLWEVSGVFICRQLFDEGPVNCMFVPLQRALPFGPFGLMENLQMNSE